MKMFLIYKKTDFAILRASEKNNIHVFDDTEEKMEIAGDINTLHEYTLNSNLELVKKSDESINLIKETRSKEKWRALIKNLLNGSDWTRLDDAKITPEKKEEFRVWRKALVDIDIENTDTRSNPPVIPTRPSERSN